MDSRRFILLLLAFSVSIRLVTAIFLGDTVVELPGTADQVSYHNLALRVLGGHGFSFDRPWWPATAANAPTAHWSYLYTFFLVAVYKVFGPHPLAARIIQAVLSGILQSALAYYLGRKTHSELTGLIAATLTAFYAYFIYYSASLMTEPFFIAAILGGFALAFQLVETLNTAGIGHHAKKAIKAALMLGLVLSITVLLRQLYLLFLPFLFLWIWISVTHPHRRMAFSSLLIIAAVIILGVLPFTVYNYSRFHRFVLLNTNAGFAFYWGNHPVYGTRFVPILTEDMGTYQSLLPKELLHLDEASLDQELLRRGIGFILEDPLRYALLSLSRIPTFFVFWPTQESGTLSNISRLASFGWTWPLMLYGIICFIRDPSLKNLASRIAAPSSLILLFAALYTLIHLLSWALIRYRLPVDAALLVFAGRGVEDLFRRYQKSRQRAPSTI